MWKVYGRTDNRRWTSSDHNSSLSAFEKWIDLCCLAKSRQSKRCHFNRLSLVFSKCNSYLFSIVFLCLCLSLLFFHLLFEYSLYYNNKQNINTCTTKSTTLIVIILKLQHIHNPKQYAVLTCASQIWHRDMCQCKVLQMNQNSNQNMYMVIHIKY